MYCPRCGTWTPEGLAACVQCGAALAAPAPPAPAPPSGIAQGASAPVAAEPVPVYGGFWRRMAAWVVDVAVLFFPDAIVRVVIGLPTLFSLRPVLESDGPRLLIAYCFSTALWWLYAGLLESSAWQGTLGQQLLGMRVTTLAGRRISFGRASARYFAQWLSVLLCGMGYLFNLWTSKRQTLHDLVAGCVLVRPSAAPAAAGAGLAGEAS